MFVLIFVAQAALLAWEIFGNRKFPRAGDLAAGCAAIVALAVPLAPHMLLLVRESHTLPFTPKPVDWMLGELLMPSVFISGLVAAGLLVHFAAPGCTGARPNLPAGACAMILVWWSFGPILFFAISHESEMRMFVARYVAYSGLALALLLTYIGYSIFGAGRGLTWILLGSLMTTASPLGLARLHEPGKDELAPIMSIIQEESAGAQANLPPVLFRSELPESDFYDWRAGNAPNSYLFAPFAAYPMKNDLLPLPYRLTAEVRDHVANLIATRLASSEKVIFVTHEVLWIPWFEERFEQAGFKYRWVQPNNFYVVVFERHPAKR